MENTPDYYTFDISVSLKCYDTKEQWGNPKELADMKYRKARMSFGQFEDAVRQGYCLCHYFTDSNIFLAGDRDYEHFQSAHLMFYDVDGSDVPMHDYVSSLKYEPTMYYTTSSNGVKGFRFRLAYVLSKPIVSTESYRTAYDWIRQEAGIGDLKDNCGRSCTQFMYGNPSKDCEFVCSGKVYRLPDSLTTPTDCAISFNNKEMAPSLNHIDWNDTFLDDLRRMSLKDFWEKYRSVYQYFDCTNLDYHDGYADIPDDYIEIIRKREWTTDKNGRPRFVRHKWRNGEGRRTKLAYAALLFRKMKPDISLEHLTFCLATELLFNYDYNDPQDPIAAQDIIARAKYAYAKTAEELTFRRAKNDTRKFKIDKAYWTRQKVSPRAAVGKVRGMRNDQALLECYQSIENVETMSNDQLLEETERRGLTVSKSTLQRFKRKHGLARSYQKTDNPKE